MTFIDEDDLPPLEPDELAHIGILRKSGRYPWGSGENPNQRNAQFLDHIDGLKKKGMSEADICKALGITSTQLRAAKAIAKNQQRAEAISAAQRLKEKGLSNSAIAEKLGLPGESSVRRLLDPSVKDKNDVLISTAEMLKKELEEKGMLDIGEGSEYLAGVSRTNLDTAVAMLREEGYELYRFKADQLGGTNQTNMKVLALPDTPYRDVYQKQEDIHQIGVYSDDNGRTFKVIETPLPVDSSRVAIKYGPDGGADADGVVYVRPGVDDLSLGKNHYAQVRIAVDGTHYIKGMAVYRDDLPDGVDLMFNTNKKDTGNKLDALKPLQRTADGEIDDTNPFGAIVRQMTEVGADGKVRVKSAMNIVNEQEDWDDWSKNLASQMLSKQPPSLAKRQLDLTYADKKAEYDEIMALTNPVIKKKLLQEFADSVDASAVHLKAKALPGQKTHVILPINSLKENEIYAPNYKNGDVVALVRYPHGGIFEIPELVVNNKNVEGRDTIKQATTAVGINSKVASRLSGADFDGDTVLVIPNNNRQVKTSKPLEGLKNFDPQSSYPGYKGMKVMANTQTEMGMISNLITDMTIQGATHSELARAVRHSMVVIDAEKHKLNYKQSAADNAIGELKQKYQGKTNGGATTLISRSTSDMSVPERKDRRAADGGKIDPKTGKKMYTETGATYLKTKKDGSVVEVAKTTKTSKGAEATDLHKLTSAYDNKGNKISEGTRIESVYANHGNRLKALANDARKAYYNTGNMKSSPEARRLFKDEVASLNSKLALAKAQKPLHRQAQLVASVAVKAKKAANPGMTKEQIAKQNSIELATARARLGATKTRIEITPREWSAIQAGAVSNNLLESLIKYTDTDVIKQYATPRTKTTMSGVRVAKAKAMLSMGYTQAEVAESLGVSVSTLNGAL